MHFLFGKHSVRHNKANKQPANLSTSSVADTIMV